MVEPSDEPTAPPDDLDYEPPVVFDIGTVAELTLAGGDTNPDGLNYSLS